MGNKEVISNNKLRMAEQNRLKEAEDRRKVRSMTNGREVFNAYNLRAQLKHTVKEIGPNFND